MILSFLLSILFLILCVVLFFLAQYNPSIDSEGMIYSSDEVDVFNEPYVPLHGTKNDYKAAVLCRNFKESSRRRLEYKGVKDCRIFKDAYETEYSCKNACCGFGTCINACPQEAISIKNGIAFISDACNGCGLCIDVCPQHLIKLFPVTSDVWVDCTAPDCMEVSEKLKPAAGDFIDPMQRKVEYLPKRRSKLWKGWYKI